MSKFFYRNLSFIAVVLIAFVIFSTGYYVFGLQNGSISVGQQRYIVTVGSVAQAAAGVDYTADGVADDVTFQQALNALPASGGQIVVLSGNYTFAAVVSRAIDNVTWIGLGKSSYLARDGISPAIDVGTQSNWTFSNLRFDAAGIDVSSATNYIYDNVYLGTTYYPYTSSFSLTSGIDLIGGSSNPLVKATQSGAGNVVYFLDSNPRLQLNSGDSFLQTWRWGSDTETTMVNIHVTGRTSGTASTGFGSEIAFDAEDDDGAEQTLGSISSRWVNLSGGNLQSRTVLEVKNHTGTYNYLLSAVGTSATEDNTIQLGNGYYRAQGATPIGYSVTNSILTVGTLGSIVLPVKVDASAAPSDSDGGNLSGSVVWNSANSRLYVRDGTTWGNVNYKGVTVTGTYAVDAFGVGSSTSDADFAVVRLYQNGNNQPAVLDTAQATSVVRELSLRHNSKEGICLRQAGATSNVNVAFGNDCNWGTTAENVIAIYNGVAPTTSPANKVQIWAEDINASSELRVRDEAGDVTTLSPHNFTLFSPSPTYEYPWSYYSRNDYLGYEINVDMFGAIREIEKLSGKQFIYLKSLTTAKGLAGWNLDQSTEGSKSHGQGRNGQIKQPPQWLKSRLK